MSILLIKTIGIGGLNRISLEEKLMDKQSLVDTIKEYDGDCDICDCENCDNE